MNKTLWLTPDWPAPENIQAICTTAAFGNVATHAGDQTHVFTNRARLRSEFNLGFEPAWLNQTHSNCIKEIKQGIESPICAPISNCDGSYTLLSGQPCVVMSADCLPLFICDKAGKQVAAVHAGWRGLANGVIAQALACFSRPEEALVWLGPAIGPKAFEVGQEVADIFLGLNTQNRQAMQPKNQAKWHIDMYELAKIQLNLLGVKTENCYGGEYCTYSQTELFYSHRRNNQAGRMASLIWMS